MYTADDRRLQSGSMARFTTLQDTKDLAEAWLFIRIVSHACMQTWSGCSVQFKGCTQGKYETCNCAMTHMYSFMQMPVGAPLPVV